jgi:hypothetical protein
MPELVRESVEVKASLRAYGHRSVKRVASAVGEGSMAVRFVHQYLSRVPE